MFLSLAYYLSAIYALPPYLATSGFAQQLGDEGFRQFLAVGMWTSAFLLADFLFDAMEHVMGYDVIHGVYVGHNTLQGLYGFTLEWLVRLLFVSAVGVQALVQYTGVSDDRKIVLAFCCEAYTRIVAMVLCTATMSDTFDQMLLERRGALLTTGIFAVSQLVVFFGTLASVQSDAVLLVTMLARIGVWISFLALGGLCLLCWRSLVNRARLLGRQSINTKEWTFMLFSFLFSFFVIVYFTLRGAGGRDLNFAHLETSSVLALKVHMGSWIVYAVVAVLLPVRIARLNVRKARHRIISTKRDVSELVNAPLKVVQTSLSYILSNPDPLADPACREHLALVASACETTIEKLVHISSVPDDDAYTIAVQSEVSAEDRYRGDPTATTPRLLRQPPPQELHTATLGAAGRGAVESSVAAVSGGDLEASVLWKAPPSVGSGGHLARVAAAAGGGVAGEEAGEHSRPPSSSSFSGPPPSLATRDASSLTLSPRLGGGVPDDRKKDSSPPPQQPQPDPTNTAPRASPVAGRDGWVTSPGWCDPKVEVALTRSEALQVAGELALAVDVVMLAVRGLVGTDDTSSASSDDRSLTHGLGPSDRFALALCLKRLCVLHKALGHFPLAEERCVAGISSIRAHMCFHIFSLIWYHSIHGCIRVLEGLGTEFGDGAVDPRYVAALLFLSMVCASDGLMRVLSTFLAQVVGQRAFLAGVRAGGARAGGRGR